MPKTSTATACPICSSRISRVESNALYRNLGGGVFEDRDAQQRDGDRQRCPGSAGAAAWRISTTTAGPIASSPTATWMTTPDSWGGPYMRILRSSSQPGGTRFRFATRDAGPYFESDHVGRGAAFGDLDDDGDIDIVVNHKDGPPALLRNDTNSQSLDSPVTPGHPQQSRCRGGPRRGRGLRTHDPPPA